MTTFTLALPGVRWHELHTHFAQRAIDGVEQVVGDVYQRTTRLEQGWAVLSLSGADGALIGTVSSPDPTGVAEARTRHLVDAGADPAAIADHLSRDPGLAPIVAAYAPLRVMGGWTPFEIAMRSVLGQQVSIERAGKLNGRLVQRCGEPIHTGIPGLTHLFPTPEQVLHADLTDLGVPGSRARALTSLARAVLNNPALFAPDADVDVTVARLVKIHGVGPWTANYIAMRACRHPDAFVASDAGVLRGAAVDGVRPTPAALTARAEAWRPYRAYAAQYLWAHDTPKDSP